VVLAIATTFTMVGDAARAQTHDMESGNYWLQVCTSRDVSQSTMCLAYLMSVLHFDQVLGWGNVWRPFCPPPEVTIGQMEAIVIKELRENPAKLHQPFMTLTLEALSKAFPCQDAPQASTR
jgi:hypothetical protein